MPAQKLVLGQVGIARMALEPLAVLAAVCAPGVKDALALPLHPLLKLVPAEDALAAMQRQVITAVNQVLPASAAQTACMVRKGVL